MPESPSSPPTYPSSAPAAPAQVIFPDGRTELLARKEALKAAAELKVMTV